LSSRLRVGEAAPLSDSSLQRLEAKREVGVRAVEDRADSAGDWAHHLNYAIIHSTAPVSLLVLDRTPVTGHRECYRVPPV